MGYTQPPSPRKWCHSLVVRWGMRRVRVAGCLLLTIHRFCYLCTQPRLTHAQVIPDPQSTAPVREKMTPAALGSDGSLNNIPLRCARLLTTATESLSLRGYVSTIRSRPPNPFGTSTHCVGVPNGLGSVNRIAETCDERAVAILAVVAYSRASSDFASMGSTIFDGSSEPRGTRARVRTKPQLPRRV